MSDSFQHRRRRYAAGEIARTAMRLFGERGFDDVTVDEIAAAVGISSRTFFRYYSSKDEVVLQYLRRIRQRLVEALAARPIGEGPVTALREAYLQTSQVAPEDRDSVLRTTRFLASSRALQARARGEGPAESGPVVALLADRMGVDPGVDPRPETIAVAMEAAAAAAFDRWLTSGGHGNPADQISVALGLLERGLAALDGVGRERREGRIA